MDCIITKLNKNLEDYTKEYGQELGLILHTEDLAFSKAVGVNKSRIYSNNARINLFDKTKNYNTKNIRSNSVSFKQVSPTSWKISEVKIGLSPFSRKNREDREAIRSEEGKTFIDVTLEVSPEVKEARQIQKKDAERTGEEYTDQYLFEEQQQKVQTTQNNLKQINKVKETQSLEEIKRDLINNFNNYFPSYSSLSRMEKEMFVEMMSAGELQIIC
jgi:hypothetical protein